MEVICNRGSSTDCSCTSLHPPLERPGTRFASPFDSFDPPQYLGSHLHYQRSISPSLPPSCEPTPWLQPPPSRQPQSWQQQGTFPYHPDPFIPQPMSYLMVPPPSISVNPPRRGRSPLGDVLNTGNTSSRVRLREGDHSDQGCATKRRKMRQLTPQAISTWKHFKS